jgi:hypothetical protein
MDTGERILGPKIDFQQSTSTFVELFIDFGHRMDESARRAIGSLRGASTLKSILRAAVTAALGSLLLAGCTHAGSEQAAKAQTAAVDQRATWSDPAAAARAGAVGKTGSACPLPVAFALAKSWKPAAVPAGVAEQGGFTLRCEVDAKPAGHLGYLRVWVGTGDDPAAALEHFLAGQPGVRGRQNRTAQAGTLTAAESTYLTDNADIGVHRQERLLAVTAPKGAVVLELGGLSADEHRAMLPAFVLAKESLTPAS